MNIYELLDKNKNKRTSFDNLSEKIFFDKHKDKLSELPRFSFLYDSLEEFDIMRANIILHGLVNKDIIEKEAENLKDLIKKDKTLKNFKNALKERIVELNYYQCGKNKIYIPFFSRAINAVYANEPEKLLDHPYVELKKEFDKTAIDPFDTYSSDIYDSSLTRLIKVISKGKETFFFHYDTMTIYVVNDQGRLDNKIVLFDKYLENIDSTNMLTKIKDVAEPYFNNDREGFIKKLLDNGFISNKLYQMILKNK